MQFGEIARYGKKSAILGRGTKPQHIGVSPFRTQKD
jgi:hypothetical protein